MLHKKFYIENKVVAVWKISESEEELFLLSGLDAACLAGIEHIRSEKRRVEKLAVSCLFRELDIDYSLLTYTPAGKPELRMPGVYVSISHSGSYAAVVSSDKPVGIDIQKPDEKVKNVRHRFVSDDELIDPENELNHLLLHWAAKEAAFKWMGKEEVSLTEHLHVKPFRLRADKGCFDVFETKTGLEINSKAYYWLEKDFVLVLVGH